MGQYSLEISKKVKNDLVLHSKSGDTATIKRIEKILEELSVHPFTGMGNPKPLKHQLSGYWSRRLNSKDRIVYQVKDDILVVVLISALGHYD
jgi:toxin YoeB